MTNVAQKQAVAVARAYILRDPTRMAVQPRHFVRTGTGGKKWVNDTPEPSEVVRIVPNRTTTEKQPVRVTPDGRSLMPGWMVVALPTSRIKVGAILTDDSGTRYEIIYVSRVPSWRLTFEAVEDGQ